MRISKSRAALWALLASFVDAGKGGRLFNWTRPKIERKARVKDEAWKARRKKMRAERMARKKKRGWA